MSLGSRGTFFYLSSLTIPLFFGLGLSLLVFSHSLLRTHSRYPRLERRSETFFSLLHSGARSQTTSARQKPDTRFFSFYLGCGSPALFTPRSFIACQQTVVPRSRHTTFNIHTRSKYQILRTLVSALLNLLISSNIKFIINYISRRIIFPTFFISFYSLCVRAICLCSFSNERSCV